MTQPLMPAQQIISQDIKLLDIYTKQIEMSADMKALKDTLPDHESRIRALERWRYGLPLASLLAVGSVALSVYEALHK